MSVHRLGIVLCAAVLLAAVGVTLFFVRQHHRLGKEAARRQREVGRGPRVFVAEVRPGEGARELTLPADVRGFFQSTILAKVSGYVKSLSVDKGDRVQKGQLLGQVMSPELDQQVASAAADLVIKRRTYERYRILVRKSFVSVEDYEISRSQYQMSRAALEQMRALQDYERLRAPFDGTVTARYLDPGALASATTPLLDVADLSQLRVVVYVQQDAAAFLDVGDPVTLTVPERPALKITAQVSRISRALDPRSRTMLCEIWLPNRDRLYPGTYVNVALRLKSPPLPVAPSSAILFHDHGPAAAVVRDSRIHFVPVRIGLDDGRTVQIVSGLSPGERVALNVPAELPDGALVQALEPRDVSARRPPR